MLVVVGLTRELQVRAEVRLPKVFGSHMVLQREKPLVIWGWGDANEQVTVLLGDESRQVKANQRGGMESHLACPESRRAIHAQGEWVQRGGA